MITKPKIWLAISSATMVICLVIIFTIRPLWGIDFIGGTLLEIQGRQLTTTTIDTVFQELNLPATIQTTEANSFLIRTTAMSTDQHAQVLERLREHDQELQEQRFETVGPTIGAELRRKAWIAVSLSILVTILYLAYEFRHTGGLVSSWKLGAAAAIALVHDLLVVTAVFVILGKTHFVPIDALFVTAMLALGGYSVNDTIVLFNRLKQEWLAVRSGSLTTLIDKAAKLTLIRSLNTSIPIFLTLLTLLFFGGATIHWFILALTIGTITGAYSTLFVAPPFLYLFSRK